MKSPRLVFSTFPFLRPLPLFVTALMISAFSLVTLPSMAGITLQVTVMQDDSAVPVAGCNVVLKDASGTLLMNGTTNEQGQVSMAVEVGKEYRMTASKDGFLDMEEETIRVDEQGKNSLNVEIHLYKYIGFFFKGHVVEAGSDQPLAGAVVTVTNMWNESETYRAETEAGGAFRMQLDGKSLKDKVTMAVRLEKPGYQPLDFVVKMVLHRQGDFNLNKHKELILKKE